MSTSRGIETNVLLAELIEVWARKHGLITNPILQRLITDLIGKKQLSIWSIMDPFDYLPFPDSKRGETYAKVIKTLSIIRNSLVFVPAVTIWIAFGQATTAYAEYSNVNLDSQVNFLQFWEDGFDLLANLWLIKNVTLLSTISIIGVIFLTFSTNYLVSLSESLVKKDETALDYERTQIAFAIKDYLFSNLGEKGANRNRSALRAAGKMIERSERSQRPRR